MLLNWALIVVGTIMFLVGPLLIVFRIRVAAWQTRGRADVLDGKQISPWLVVWWGFWFMVVGGGLVAIIIGNHLLK